MNQANGRFATVGGGSKNFARGRFSLALGYQADAVQMHSAALSFGGSDSSCTTTYENEFAMCADKVTINGQELFPTSRRLVEEETEKLGEENQKKIAALREMTGAQEKTILARDKLIGELQAAIALLDQKVGGQ